MRIFQPERFGPYVEEKLAQRLERDGGEIAVRALVQEADAASAAGDLPAEAALLEVLLPIAIREHGLASSSARSTMARLAQVYLRQGQYRNAATPAIMALNTFTDMQETPDLHIELLDTAAAAAAGDIAAGGGHEDTTAIVVDCRLRQLGLEAQVGAPNYETAVRLFDFCQQHCPTDREAWGNAAMWKGDGEIAAGRYAEAEASFQHVLDLLPDRPEFAEPRQIALERLELARTNARVVPDAVVNDADGSRSQIYEAGNVPVHLQMEVAKLMAQEPAATAAAVPSAPTEGLPLHQARALEALDEADRQVVFAEAMELALAADDLRSLMGKGLALMDGGTVDTPLPAVEPELARRFQSLLSARNNLNPWPLLAATMEDVLGEQAASGDGQFTVPARRSFLMLALVVIAVLAIGAIFLTS